MPKKKKELFSDDEDVAEDPKPKPSKEKERTY